MLYTVGACAHVSALCEIGWQTDIGGGYYEKECFADRSGAFLDAGHRGGNNDGQDECGRCYMQSSACASSCFTGSFLYANGNILYLLLVL